MIAVSRMVLPLFITAGIAKYLSVHIHKKEDQAYLKKNEESIKFRGYYNTLISWMGLLQNGSTIAEYFSESSSVAVYGMGKIGELICRELMENGIQVSYGIDGNASGENLATGLQVYLADKKNLPEVDFIVVSINHLADSIIPQLEELTSAEIITIDELLEAVWDEKSIQN